MTGQPRSTARLKASYPRHPPTSKSSWWMTDLRMARGGFLGRFLVIGSATTPRPIRASVWLLNLVGNAALLAAVYFWLLMPDAHGWQVGGSGVIAIVVVFFGVWLRTGTFAYFRVAEFRDNATVWRAFRHALRHMVALAIWAASLAVLVWLLWNLRTYTPQAGVWIRQKLNGGPPPRNVTRDLNWLIVLIVWVFIPAVWLPIASTVAAAGFRLKRMARSLRVLRRPAYWVWFCALMLAGAYVPYKLV